jgi:prolyl oligopeptidase
VTCRKDVKLDGKNPCLLYGYGGFNIAMTPGFSTQRLAWLEKGGVYAQAVLRGGSEYGEEWHQAGMLGKKQNVFDDFVACAEQLIKDGFTSTPRLAIHGGSNGGLLVGACLTQRPDLFGAAVASVGVLDMLRYDQFTIGAAWAPEYGRSSDPAQFAWLHKYSPLHAVKPGASYPATLILTGDHDDRVMPAHSFKFAATMQAAQAGSSPVLIRIETRAGHGAGKSTQMIIEEAADLYSFLTRALAADGA